MKFFILIFIFSFLSLHGIALGTLGNKEQKCSGPFEFVPIDYNHYCCTTNLIFIVAPTEECSMSYTLTPKKPPQDATYYYCCDREEIALGKKPLKKSNQSHQ